MSKRVVAGAICTMLVVAMAAPVGAQPSPQVVEAGDEVSIESEHRVVVETRDGAKLVSVVIDLEQDGLASYAGELPGLAATSPAVTGEDDLDVSSPRSRAYLAHLEREQRGFEQRLRRAAPQARVTEQYQIIIGGVAALVPPDELEEIEALPGVRGVYLDRIEQIQTDASHAFMGTTGLWDQLGGQDQAGEGTIVGILDTGVWPEHPSLSDPDPLGKPYTHPGGEYVCDFGSDVEGDDNVACNNKLIGAHRFMAAQDATNGPGTYFRSGRDDNGHGTHTGTTAAGNAGVEASVLGADLGVISGVAPRAHVISYKVCGATGSCFTSDSAAAIQQSLLDGVDVLNFSVGGGTNPYNDIVSLAFLDAYNAGVFVAASAGNSGPGANTVGHREPWTMTVGASTSDRHFMSTVSLTGDDGASLEVDGATITGGIDTPTEVVMAPGDGQCFAEDLAPGTFDGEIVVCYRGFIARASKSMHVRDAGGSGLILVNQDLLGVNTDSHYIPTVHLEVPEGQQLLSFLSDNDEVTATFTSGEARTVRGDVMAGFSSRGGSGQTLGISKPDVTGPGIQILAGNTPISPAYGDGGLGAAGELYQAIAGTSMSSPHGAGAAALLRDAHPDWTPGEIKSALMLAAQSQGVVKEDGTTPTTPFDDGAGSMRPLAAANVPFTMDESGLNYLALADRLWDANYPSVYVPRLAGSITLERTLRSQDARGGRLSLQVVDAPSDLRVTVPRSIALPPAGGEVSFPIAIDARTVPIGQVRHAALQLTYRGQQLRMPISIVRTAAPVSVGKVCDPADIARRAITECEITLENTGLRDATVSVIDELPRELQLIRDSVEGGVADGNRVLFEGTLDGASPPTPVASVIPTNQTFGYLPLAGFSGTPVPLGTDSVVNFNVPAFQYAGQTHSLLGIGSNGYVVAGGAAPQDVAWVNQNLPDPDRPNNVLAPFWTDMDVEAAGRVLIATLRAGPEAWIVVEWEGVANYDDHSQRNTAQVWIGYDGGAPTWFTYGNLAGGNSGAVTVGAENADGTAGNNVFYNGVGQAPTPSSEGYAVAVTSQPGAPGETHTIRFSARGQQVGDWTNYVVVTSDVFAGQAITGFSGSVTPR
jgi:hypothetical protein